MLEELLEKKGGGRDCFKAARRDRLQWVEGEFAADLHPRGGRSGKNGGSAHWNACQEAAISAMR
jgi:hypothetical protein